MRECKLIPFDEFKFKLPKEEKFAYSYLKGLNEKGELFKIKNGFTDYLLKYGDYQVLIELKQAILRHHFYQAITELLSAEKIFGKSKKMIVCKKSIVTNKESKYYVATFLKIMNLFNIEVLELS